MCILTVTGMICFLLVCKFCEIKYYHIFDTRATTGQDGSGLEFHVNFGSGRLSHLIVGRVGSGQENWTHVQLCDVPINGM